MFDLVHNTLLVAQGEPSSAFLFWGVMLGVVAVAMVGLELFVPSGGLLTLLAVAALIASLVAFFMYDSLAGVAALLSYMVLTPFAIKFGFSWWVNSSIGRHAILSGDVGGADSEDGATHTPLATSSEQVSLRELIGAEGEAITPLRPVGSVKIMGERVDALAENGSIDAGAPIVVTDVYDNQVKVRERD